MARGNRSSNNITNLTARESDFEKAQREYRESVDAFDKIVKATKPFGPAAVMETEAYAKVMHDLLEKGDIDGAFEHATNTDERWTDANNEGRMSDKEAEHMFDVLRAGSALPFAAREVAKYSPSGRGLSASEGSMAAAQAARMDAHLNSLIRYQGQVMKWKDLIDQKLAAGNKVHAHDVPDEAREKALEKAIENLKKANDGFIPTGNANHPTTIKYKALKDELAAGPTKKEYRLEDADGRGITITKTLADYVKSKGGFVD